MRQLDPGRNIERKIEYTDISRYSLASSSDSHNLIAANIIIAIGVQIKNSPYKIYPYGQKVGIPDSTRIFYPDALAIYGEAMLAGDEKDAILNPTLIIEVVAENTAADDRGKKFHSYQEIDTLKEYILVAQDEFSIEQYVKQDNGIWHYLKITGLGKTVGLPSINCELELRDVYNKVALGTSGSLAELPVEHEQNQISSIEGYAERELSAVNDIIPSSMLPTLIDPPQTQKKEESTALSRAVSLEPKKDIPSQPQFSLTQYAQKKHLLLWIISSAILLFVIIVVIIAYNSNTRNVKSNDQISKSASNSQPEVGALSGRIVGPDGKGVPSMFVSLSRYDGRGRFTVMTDNEGRYLVQWLVPGEYKLEAYKPDYAQAVVPNLNIAGGTTPLDISLKPTDMIRK